MESKIIKIYIHLPISTFDHIEEEEEIITKKVCNLLLPYKENFTLVLPNFAYKSEAKQAFFVRLATRVIITSTASSNRYAAHS